MIDLEDYEKFKQILGKRIMNLRDKRKMTREYLAEQVDISTKFLTKFRKEAFRKNENKETESH